MSRYKVRSQTVKYYLLMIQDPTLSSRNSKMKLFLNKRRIMKVKKFCKTITRMILFQRKSLPQQILCLQWSHRLKILSQKWRSLLSNPLQRSDLKDLQIKWSHNRTILAKILLKSLIRFNHLVFWI